MVREYSADQSVKDIANIPIIPSLLEVVCRTTGMGFAAIARVTNEKWIACGVRDEILFGIKPGEELVLETTICNEIRQHQHPVIIDNVAEDELFCWHSTPKMYGFQSYFSVPIILKDGSFFGTLCAIDPHPAKLKNQQTIGMFTLFAELISFHLKALDDLALTKAKLQQERETAELREQFIAILGHDLRNPVGAVLMGAEFLLNFSLNEEVLVVANSIKNSSYRMKGLIDNILDFARGRLGGGITLEVKDTVSLEPLLRQVIDEAGTIYPGSTIESNFKLAEPVQCDENRIGQLFSNLLNNAIIHGKAGAPVLVTAESNKDGFTLAITNYGKQIPHVTLQQLFQPFYRGEDKSGKNGLGLGLYISAQIAKAHGGEMEVVSTEEFTRFILKIPQQNGQQLIDQ